ncbi:META domain-containing protein [Microbulbifer bruguierae]|uniref:META domain-containing protein n=1 Tax=Microbulbifer bruguierae TaxID=3029061 RepID=A0ABY8N9S3_9GAMM|nr:META domain-containing protein [Microbulbifer bruguierae]WGL15646.1 META domain-containing protein [Microbulbifer bruguierae]
MLHLLPRPFFAQFRPLCSATGFKAPIFLGLLLGLLLSGCGSTATEPSNMAKTDNPGICEQQWLLESLSVDGREHKSRMFWQKMWRDRPYFTCDKLGFIRGSTGANPYLGKFKLTDTGSVKWLKQPKISRMAGRRDGSELEQDFLLALPRVTHAFTEGETLVLQGSDGTRLEFTQTVEARAH